MPHTLFRQRAIENYMQKRDQTVSARIIPPPTSVLQWALIGLFLLALFLGWWGRIPVYLTGTGVFLERNRNTASHVEVVMLIFFSSPSSVPIHRGLPLQVRATTGMNVYSKLESVKQIAISPREARLQYHLSDHVSSLLTQSPLLVTFTTESGLFAQIQHESLLSVQIQAEPQRVLSLLPGIGALIQG